jgi:hypothetical protein
MATKLVTLMAGDDWSPDVELPAKWEICSRCRGDGTHWHPAFDNGITAEDRDRDWDEESWQDLMNGLYDVRCEECKGSGKVLVVNEDAIPADLREAWEEHCKAEAEYQAELAYEARMRRMGVEW